MEGDIFFFFLPLKIFTLNGVRVFHPSNCSVSLGWPGPAYEPWCWCLQLSCKQTLQTHVAEHGVCYEGYFGQKNYVNSSFSGSL